MSLIATQPAPHPADEADITNDGWFPAVSPSRVRALARLDGTVTAPRLRHALATAMAEVNAELAGWKLQHLAHGVPALRAVPGPDVGSERVWCVYYLNAITAHARAALAEQYRDFDTTAAGDRRADELTSTVDEHRRNLRWAISALLGTPRSTVELI